jgi:hypothetical protein
MTDLTHNRAVVSPPQGGFAEFSMHPPRMARSTNNR